MSRTEFGVESQSESTDGNRSLGKALALSPVSHTLIGMSVVSIVGWTVRQSGSGAAFALRQPVLLPWWELPLSVYAHADPSHLLGNAVIVVLAGGLVSLRASLPRFHAFFVGSGMLAGVAQVAVSDALSAGTAVSNSVLGASGAALALVGYIASSNRLSSTVLRGVPRYVVVLIALAVAAVTTVYFSGGGVGRVGYVAHFIGALVGVLAGHRNVLRPGSATSR